MRIYWKLKQGENMNITKIASFLNSKGYGGSYQTIYSLLTGRIKISFKTAYSLSQIFKEKDMMEFKRLTPDELTSFFYSILPDDIRYKSCHNDKWKIDNIKKKYGDEIIQDLEKVKTNPYFPLTIIADKYNISREYAGQLYGIIYGNRYNADDGKTTIEPEISCVNDPKRKVADWKKSGTKYQGAITEKLFMCKCELLGFNVSTPCKTTFDIFVNGWIIDVKSSRISGKTSPHLKIKYNKFSILKEQREKCHFFACYSDETETFFIIPNEDMGKGIQKTKTLYISPKKSTYHTAKNKYYKYENRFDLLEAKNPYPPTAKIENK